MGADTVLLVDSQPERRQQLRQLIEFLGYGQALEAEWGGWQDKAPAESLKAVVLGAPDDGPQLAAELEAMEAWAPQIPRLLACEQALDLPAQALDQIPLPADYASLLSALYRADAYRESGLSPDGGHHPELYRNLTGNTPPLRQVRRLIQQVAGSEASVLILGESGTGKEVVARALHYLSPRRERPFVPVNCGAIPGELLESELFGHEKGAFTGAISARQGRFEMAEGGTLFLDEIGDMPLPMQVKLLRVIQERCFERVGSNKSISADVRIVAATHRDLEANIADGSFREDLYYRLNVFPIELPPLRERQADVPLLVHEFISRLEREGRGSVRLTPNALTSLCHHTWSGNVRELANLMERLAIMYPGGLVDVRDLPEKYQVEGAEPIPDLVLQPPPQETGAAGDAPAAAGLPPEGLDLKQYLSDMEQSLIKQALDEADGVVAHAAKRLKMRRTTLVEKMRKYDLQRAE